jgi:hypothetical protein
MKNDLFQRAAGRIRGTVLRPDVLPLQVLNTSRLGKFRFASQIFKFAFPLPLHPFQLDSNPSAFPADVPNVRSLFCVAITFFLCPCLGGLQCLCPIAAGDSPWSNFSS